MQILVELDEMPPTVPCKYKSNQNYGNESSSHNNNHSVHFFP